MDLESTAGRAVYGKRLGKFTSDWTLCCIRKDRVINKYIYIMNCFVSVMYKEGSCNIIENVRKKQQTCINDTKQNLIVERYT